MRTLLPAVLLVLVGCATTLSAKGRTIQETDPAHVSSCAPLGLVSGSSSQGNLLASAGMRNAQNEAIEKAADRGATHVVWQQIAAGYSPSASAMAYRCP